MLGKLCPSTRVDRKHRVRALLPVSIHEQYVKIDPEIASKDRIARGLTTRRATRAARGPVSGRVFGLGASACSRATSTATRNCRSSPRQRSSSTRAATRSWSPATIPVVFPAPRQRRFASRGSKISKRCARSPSRPENSCWRDNCRVSPVVKFQTLLSHPSHFYCGERSVEISKF